MTTYSIAEARNALPRLVSEAEQGERIIITRHGKQVAQITPLPHRDQEKRRNAQAYFAERRRQQKPLPMSVVELLHMDDEPER